MSDNLGVSESDIVFSEQQRADREHLFARPGHVFKLEHSGAIHDARTPHFPKPSHQRITCSCGWAAPWEKQP